MAKIKYTTKPGYKKGYEAAQANQPRRSPHRPGTDSEAIWLKGYDAYLNGGEAPQEPRKRRTKAEMDEARKNPQPTDFNRPRQPLSPALRIRGRDDHLRPMKPRGPGLLEKMFELREKIKKETDPELLEILHMEFADVEWTVCVLEGETKPSERWEEYKREHGLNFDRTAA